MSAYFKTVTKTVKNNLARFIAITAIIAVGVCFVAGLGAISPKILDSFSQDMKENGAADITLKSTSQEGFSDEDVLAALSLDGVEAVEKAKIFETQAGEMNVRVTVQDLKNSAVNKPVLIEGAYPDSAEECLAERGSDTLKDFRVGDTVSFMDKQITVCGIAENPLIFVRDGERDMAGDKPLEMILYFDTPYFFLPLPVTDLYIKAAGTENMNLFSKQYEEKTDGLKARLKESTAFSGAVALTLRENRSVGTLTGICDKVDVICLIFPFFFGLVVALVALTTMTRLVEEERGIIGCYKTLGYSNSKIAFKYLFFAALSCTFGIGIGLGIGAFFLPGVVCPTFNSLFFLPALSMKIDLTLGLIAAAIMLFCVIGVTAYAVLKDLKSSPAALLKPKAPKPGKKIFLEHVGFIWKNLKFKYKSTFRNIFRYLGRLLMTVISVAGSAALVTAGFGLYDFSSGDDIAGTAFAAMKDSFSLISLVVIIFAAALCVLVLYNLTNMNIGERSREIATLRVLGYHDKEVAGYIFREVFIMALMGIAVGIPLGIALISFVFTYLDFGALSSVHWYSYLLAAGVSALFIGIVDLMLYRKILRVDMNASLKSVE